MYSSMMVQYANHAYDTTHICSHVYPILKYTLDVKPHINIMLIEHKMAYSR
jgi:hypothetical protein